MPPVTILCSIIVKFKIIYPNGWWFVDPGPGIQGTGRDGTAPGGVALAGFADAAAGDNDAYVGMSDDELTGAIAAWDRVEAHACARKHAAVAELIRRRPEPGCLLQGEARMPEAWDEFCADEL